MNWIDDIKNDVAKLDFSRKNLMKFGKSVGLVLILAAALLLWSHPSSVFAWLIEFGGIILLLFGLMCPERLRHFYKYWMTMAFVLGGIMGKIFLTAIFFFIITPIAFFAKVVRKEFMDVNFTKSANSYWINRDSTKKINYEKKNC